MFQNQRSTAFQRAGTASYDAGLRSYMLRIYNYMSGALVITGLVAFFASTNQALMQTIYGTPLQWVVMLAPLGFILALSFGVHKMKVSTVQTLFWTYSAAMGLSLSYIFLAYTGESIARVFFITAGTFAGMSLYGYTTKRDLTKFGSFLIMGLIGIIIASLVNIFMQSSALSFAVSALGVLIFTGLIAYDTQRLRNVYFMAGGQEQLAKASIMGALTLYLDFVNLMIMLLRFFGERR